MISAIKTVRTDVTVPYDNLALEHVLTEHVRAGECILFLWQNRDTVVIGKNQNAWEECRLDWLEAHGGHLARRLSGGGAVYHDLGNLNFSLITRREDYDTARQSEVILRAVRRLGVPAERTGRNDIEAEGRKFSGHAFYEQKGCWCHHGTLMMDVNLDRMQEALSVPQAKLRSRGVSSVRSRVVNLKTYCPGICREQMEAVLTEAFEEVYGLRRKALEPERVDSAEVRETAGWMASREWILGRRIPFTAVLEERFPWGGFRLELSVTDGHIVDAACWSDAMDEKIIPCIGQALLGCPYDGERMAERVMGMTISTQEAPLRTRMAEDIARMIRVQTGSAERKGDRRYGTETDTAL